MSENGTETATPETATQPTNSNVTDAAETNEPIQPAEQFAPDAMPENAEAAESADNPEDVSYHTVEKEGKVTAIWEMQGRKHIRTIDPRSNEGKQILELFETAA